MWGVWGKVSEGGSQGEVGVEKMGKNEEEWRGRWRMGDE